ncbi:MAG: hypothetical protein K2L98_02810, partial [Bacilli bacterium]|nr:hypothetical protein [Bacilli bacterium]
MNKYNINNQEDLENAIKEIFPKEKYAVALEIVERTKRLVPDTEEPTGYIMDLIKFTDTILNGDRIQQCFSLETYTKFAKNALEELMKVFHEQRMESMRLERQSLQKENEDLEQKADTLKEQVSQLESDKKDLVKKNASLSVELEKLNNSLEDRKANGLKQVEEEVGSERQKVEDEIKALEEQKNVLSTSIDELKNIIKEYNQQIAALGNEEEVTWEPISADSPIYNLTSDTVDEYIEYLIFEYMEKTNTPREKTEIIVKKCLSGLYSIAEYLKNHTWGGVNQPSISCVLAIDNGHLNFEEVQIRNAI